MNLTVPDLGSTKERGSSKLLLETKTYTNNLITNINTASNKLSYEENLEQIDYSMVMGRIQQMSLFKWKDKEFFALRFFTDFVAVLVSEFKKSFTEEYPKQVLYADSVVLALEWACLPDFHSIIMNKHLTSFSDDIFLKKINWEALVQHLSQNPRFVLKNVLYSAMEEELINHFPSVSKLEE